MGRACKPEVVCFILLTLLLLFPLPWFRSGSLQPASGFFTYEVDEMLGQERQGKVQVSRSNPDVVTVAGLGVGQLGQRRLCPPGSFRLSTMETCMPWLGYKEIADEVTTLHKIGSGFVKKVYKAIWRNHTVAYSKLTKMAPVKLEYFSRDIKMLKALQHPSVLQFVRVTVADSVTMGRACKPDVICPLLLTLLLLYLLPWFWSGSLQPASGFFNYEVDEMLGQERQGKVEESRSSPDVVTEAGLGVGQLGQRRLCPPGSFRLSTMETCMPWLGCKEITNEVTTLDKIGSGSVKEVTV
ncbi:hypothetical protein Bbelb_193170 [Branchiostoma belcheri]|nr:hypothetical protein Bbelb_193170 [Branchiostoma belcheri]